MKIEPFKNKTPKEKTQNMLYNAIVGESAFVIAALYGLILRNTALVLVGLVTHVIYAEIKKISFRVRKLEEAKEGK